MKLYRSSVRNGPLWRTAWRRIIRRPFQSILLVLGVALGVAMMISVDLANGSASRAFELSTDAVAGRTTHRIVGGPQGLDEGQYRRLKIEQGLSPVAPIVEGYVLALELGQRPVRLLGVDPFAEPPFRDYFGSGQATGIDGLVAFLAEPNTVIIAKDVAEENGLDLGESISIDISGRLLEMKIVGLLDPADEISRRALSSLIFTDIATAQELLGKIGRLSHIDLIIDEETQANRIKATLPPGIRLETAAARSNTLQQMASAFELNLTALSMLALVVGMFLIYNTITFSIVQRRRLFGILRSLGVTGDQLFTLIVVEAAALGFVGALLGLVAGVLLGRGIVNLVSQTINDFYFIVNVQDVSVPATTLVKGLAIGVTAAIGAALVPAVEAMGTAPQNSLRRSTLESKTRRISGWLLLLFVVMVGAGSFLLWLQGVSLIITFAGLFVVLVAFAFLTPALTRGLMRLVAQPLNWIFGPIGRMAPRDISRSLSRTSVAIGALMIAVSVIVGVSIMIGSFRQTVSQWLANTLQADVYLSPPALTASRLAGELDQELIRQAQSWPGIDRIVQAWHQDILAPEIGRPVEIIAVDGDVSNGNRSYAWIDGERSEVWARLERGEGVLLSEPLLLRENLGLPPPPVTLLTEAGPREFPVIAVFYDYASDQGSILMDRNVYEQHWPPAGVTSVGMFVETGQDADEIASQLQEAFRGRADIVVQSNQSLRGNALDIFDRTFAITAALQLLAIVVAFIGVLSALLSLQLERTRELGVLRATGMTIRQLWQMTLLETGLMGSAAGLMALPVGWVLAWILIYVINRRSFGWTLQMDLEPGYFLEAFIVALVAAILAGLYPAIRLGAMTIATAIREE